MKKVIALISIFLLFTACKNGNEFSKVTNTTRNETSNVVSSPEVEPEPGQNDSAPNSEIKTKVITKKESRTKLDILVVFDNSSSMKEENLEMADKMDGFIEDLKASGLDFNICFTKPDAGIFEHGRISKWINDERVLNSSTNNISNVFYDTVDKFSKNVFFNSSYEEPIRATYFMLKSDKNKDCFRDNTDLEVIFLTDENENNCDDNCKEISFNFKREKAKRVGHSKQSINNSPLNLMRFAHSKLGHKNFAINPIILLKGFSNCPFEVNEVESGVTHEIAARITGGVLGDICHENYATQLKSISNNIKVNLGTIKLDCNPAGQVKVSSLNNLIKYRAEQTVKGLKITPALKNGHSIELEYKCEVN